MPKTKTPETALADSCDDYMLFHNWGAIRINGGMDKKGGKFVQYYRWIVMASNKSDFFRNAADSLVQWFGKWLSAGLPDRFYIRRGVIIAVEFKVLPNKVKAGTEQDFFRQFWISNGFTYIEANQEADLHQFTDFAQWG